MLTDQHRAGTQVPRSARIAVAILFFLNGVMMASWATRIPAIQDKLALSAGTLGLALLGIAIGALTAMNVFGYLAARFGSRSVVITAAICLCIALSLLAFAPTLPVLVVVMVFFGASNGLMDVAMNTQGVAVELRYSRPILNSFHAYYSLGGIIGAIITSLVASHGLALETQFLSIAIFCAIIILIVARFLLPASADSKGTGKTFAFPSGALLALGLVAFCVVLAEGAIADWSAIYLSGTLRTGAGLAAIGYAAFSIMMAIGRGIGDPLTIRLGARNMVRLGGLIAALGLTIALVFSWIPLALVGFGLIGVGLSIIFPLTLSAAGRASTRASGAAIAAVATCGYFGFLVGPPVIGFVADAISLRIALGFVVVLCLCAAVGASAVSNDKRLNKNQQIETIERTEPSLL
jgi:MFS family permease